MRRFVYVLLALACLGADCERERLVKLDHGQLTAPDDGRKLYPVGGPWVLYADPYMLDHPDAVHESAGYINQRFGTYWLDVLVDADAFFHAGAGDYGDDMLILLTIGSLPDRAWPEPDPGGYADLDWYCRDSEDECYITRCEIVLDVDVALSWQATRDYLLHELGHCPFGFAHDEDSVDLGSCMSSPPTFDCEFTDSDVDRVEGR